MPLRYSRITLVGMRCEGYQVIIGHSSFSNTLCLNVTWGEPVLKRDYFVSLIALVGCYIYTHIEIQHVSDHLRIRVKRIKAKWKLDPKNL